MAIADGARERLSGIARLRGMGLRPVLLTGDNDRAAQAVPRRVGIGEVMSGVLAAGKAEAVRRLQDSGRVVAMAGDGVNDAAALVQADLGLDMGTGTGTAALGFLNPLIAGAAMAFSSLFAVTNSLRPRRCHPAPGADRRPTSWPRSGQR